MGKDVVDLIMADHREVERLFTVLKDHPERRELVLPEVTALLVAHSRAEEAEVYPAARDEAGEADEVAHSQQEHAQAEQLLQRLGEVPSNEKKYEQLLDQLVDDVSHHVHDEETTVLPGMRQSLSDSRRADLAEAFAAARAQHLGDRPGEATRDELRQQAQNAGLEGRSQMNKDELSENLRQD